MAIKPFKVRDKLLVGGSQVDGNVSAEFLANDAIQLPRGTTGERPSTGVNGLLRYNTTLAEIEGYISGAWGSVGGGANVQALGTAPSSPNLGDIWFNTTEEILYLRINNGTEDTWLDVTTDPFGPQFTASGSAPGTPGYNDLWFDTTDDILSVYVNDGSTDVWMDIVTGGEIANSYVSVANQSFSAPETAQARSNIKAKGWGAGPSDNIFINGFGQYSQSSGDVAANTNDRATFDLWDTFQTGGHDINTYSSTSDGTPNARIPRSIIMKVKVANAAPNSAAFISSRHKVEGERMAHLGFGTTDAVPVTIGFWAYATTPVTFSTSLRSSTNDRSYVKNHSIAGNTWSYYTYIVPVQPTGTWYTNTSIGANWEVCIGTGADYQNTADLWVADSAIGTTSTTNFGGLGAGNTFYFTGAYMLGGEHNIPEADALYLQDIDDNERRKIDRYYQIYLPQGAGVCSNDGIPPEYNIYRTSWSFRTQMRADPTFALTNGFNWYDGAAALGINTVTVNDSSNTHCEFNANVLSTVTGSRVAVGYAPDSSNLVFDARL